MPWYYRVPFDTRRMKRELNELMKVDPMVDLLRRKLWSKEAEEIDRLALADVCEEKGFPVLAKMVREYMTVRKPRKRPRFKWVKRRGKR